MRARTVLLALAIAALLLPRPSAPAQTPPGHSHAARCPRHKPEEGAA